MFIEQQATVQVIMHQVAIGLDPSEPGKLSQLGSICAEVNSVLDDPSTGGGACKGHTFVLTLHLLKHLKSFRKFTELLTVKFNTICQGITCLKQLCCELKVCYMFASMHASCTTVLKCDGMDSLVLLLAVLSCITIATNSPVVIVNSLFIINQLLG